jgi:flagellum-specific peptidoglycan hydrolase FlgJ
MRSWVAFRFRLNRLTLGVFQRKALLKIGFLAAAGYVLLIYDNKSLTVAGADAPSEHGIAAVEEWNASAPEKKAKPVKTKGKNEAAPVSHSDLAEEQAKEYVERFHKIAKGEMEKYGIPASISLAQGLIESRAGMSKLAVQNNNHFGIKCFSRRCGKGHCSNFTDDTHKDFFRKFKSPWESWRAHSQLLASGRYTRLKKYGRDYRQWAYGLKTVGYATDRSYAEKLIGIIERYELHQYDR